MVLLSWSRMVFVGEFSNAMLLAVRRSSALSCAWIFSASAALSLYFLTPSLMCPNLTALIAFTNDVQSVWFSGILSRRISGRLSRSVNSPRLVVVSILACLARSIIFSVKIMWVYTSSPRYFSIFPSSSGLILISANSLSNSNLLFFILSTFGNRFLKLCSKFMYLSFGVASLLNHSSAGDSDFSHSPIALIFCSSDGVTPELMKLQFMFFRKSVGWMGSSCVPANSVITLLLIFGSRSGGSIFGSGGNGLTFGDGMAGNTGSSSSDSVSDCVIDDCDDKESEDAVGDDVFVVGVIVSAQERAAKCPLKRGCAFHASVRMGFWLVLTVRGNFKILAALEFSVVRSVYL